MKRILLVLGLAISIACASAQKTEFQTVSAAVAGVEAARSAYQDLRIQCTANPTYTAMCPQVIRAHDPLMKSYVDYQNAVKLLADANIAALNTAAGADAGAKVAAATSGLLQAATDFVALEHSVTGGK